MSHWQMCIPLENSVHFGDGDSVDSNPEFVSHQIPGKLMMMTESWLNATYKHNNMIIRVSSYI